ncbi:hypothetical protein SY94_5172 (plasmid) [Agrobacterium tumefaciens]|nr:hypothetical protein SY94_5172 [Agrobacterium tumefaciens]
MTSLSFQVPVLSKVMILVDGVGRETCSAVGALPASKRPPPFQ